MWLEQVRAVGFASMADVVEPRRLAPLLSAFTRGVGRRNRAGIRHAMSLDSVVDMARGTELIGIASKILGGAAVPFRATLFDKSPTSNWLVAWHQDTALPLRERLDLPGWGPWSTKDGVTYAHAPSDALAGVIALRLHLDDSKLDNGPLRILPRTHEMGVLTDEELHKLVGKIPAVDCPVAMGGVLAMRPLVVHASSKSQSEAPRRVLHVEYARSLELDGGLELAVS
jgi:hypothetical protein